MVFCVIDRVPDSVKATHVIYSLEHVLSVNQDYMVAIVTFRVLLNVKTTRVICRMALVSVVKVDGLECIAIQVR